MKKGLFLLLAILTLGIVVVKADAAPPIYEEKLVEVTINGYLDNADLLRKLNLINNIDGVTDIYFEKKYDEEVTLIVRVIGDDVVQEIKNSSDFADAKYIDEFPSKEKEECTQTTQTSECLTNDDIGSLQKTTYLIYATLIILFILMIVVLFLIINNRKKSSKKDA